VPTNPSSHRRYALAVILLAAAAALTASCGRARGPRTSRDASGKLLFNPTPLKHTAGEPFWCFSEVKDAEDRMECQGLQDWCERSIEMSRDGGASITSGCKEVESVACYTTHVDTDRTKCVPTMDDCAKGVARDRGRIGKPEDVSECVQMDRGFQH
jgi:hypothetical protein